MQRERRESEFSDCGMTEQTNHPWDALTTITTFDQGLNNNMRSTFCLDDINENENRSIAPQEQQITQPTGILIASLLRQLCNLLEEDKVRRNKLYYTICDKLHHLQLINDTYNTPEFEMLRGQYQNALYRMLRVARGELESENALSIAIPRFITPKFRYRDEFREICFIARGGFGEVYKAQHRLDGIEYAIKKIIMPIDHIETIKQQLNEVWTLAKLKHTNIVSYNAAWMEPLSSSNISSSIDQNSYRSHISKYYRKETRSYSPQSINNLFDNKNDLNFNSSSKICLNEQNMLSKASSTIDMYTDKKKKQNEVYGNSSDSIFNRSTISQRFEELNSSVDTTGEEIVEKSDIEECTNESYSDVVSFRNSNNSENLDQAIADIESSQEVCMYTSKKNRPHVILYIQMALCEQTLEHWLRGKISVTPEPIVKVIFQQILCGVNYMHSQKVVHHDIKPSNIFISTTGQLQIQLGDFGLACPLQKEKHDSVIGTHLYAAPEQLEGKCDRQSDIYSIGIVLTELLIPIKTQMELSSIISSLKNDTVPEVFKRHKWTRLVQQMVRKDPSERPSTNQLLKEFDDDKDVIINGLKDTIVDLKNDNRIKDDTIQGLQEEIALLKEKVQKLSPGNTTK
ncbi:PREDICTED: interferon-induced, double-stranded RNA-activated protein kinase-like [Trachymyrmex septentrionalis]|uniref:interferon-induced, double-stranded RNA-activated protein kinase-like n=1 Tax=Trachymyrmex septentrionalis TaxID=34720 RepID=UPI00084F55F4|nr:PREDICTED: interferon-induced, double-stranded RNA-activated protein kinase-like [Trachymyrmex septentrionalis]XP_018347908.1 PREDICTED: interferon-induced, double-stranded RNA-activated protein kinase-like [Trachymyrmex septentrionalis]XP_018347909.1 PREDICTED: interferon-induced, double-stranded RNA-activated protein kinase-like [Trachymyrmex septentrionalis]